MTSAPSNLSRCDAYGPAITWLKSATRIPSSGLAIIPSLTFCFALRSKASCDGACPMERRQAVDAVMLERAGAPLGIALVDRVEALLVGRRHVRERHAMRSARDLTGVLGRV